MIAKHPYSKRCLSMFVAVAMALTLAPVPPLQAAIAEEAADAGADSTVQEDEGGSASEAPEEAPVIQAESISVDLGAEDVDNADGAGQAKETVESEQPATAQASGAKKTPVRAPAAISISGVTDTDEGATTRSETVVVIVVKKIGEKEVESPQFEGMDDARTWVSENGGDPDRMWKSGSRTTFTGVRYDSSDDLTGSELGGVATYLYRQEDYYEADAARETESDVTPAFAGEQMVTAGKGDFEAPLYFDLSKDAPATGAATYKVGDSVYASDAELKAFLATQSAGNVIECSFMFQGSGDYADFSDSGTLTFTMVAGVDTVAITITAPKTGDALATSATVAGTAGGVSVDKDCLPVQSVSWAPNADAAAAETVYTVTIAIKSDRGVDWADEVTATVNGAAATSELQNDVLTMTYTFPATKPVEYRNTEGDGAAWAKGSGEALTFVFKRSVNDDATFSHFAGIQVDGADVDPSNYTAVAGSVVVTLKASYLETLEPGSHTVTALFDDGNDASAGFTVKAAEETAAEEPGSEKPEAPASETRRPTGLPLTGDSLPALPGLLAALVMSGAVLLGAGIRLRPVRCHGKHVRR